MNKKQAGKPKDTIHDEILELVKARLETIPNNVRISIGDTDYSKEDILKNIEEDSDIGRDFVEMQMDYLRDLASGTLYATQ